MSLHRDDGIRPAPLAASEGHATPMAGREGQAAQSAAKASGTPQRADRASFGRIYEEHFDMAWRALCRYGVPAPELEDALQEVFMTVHDRFASFEGRSSLRTWIYGIARRVARNHRPHSLLEVCDPLRFDEFAGQPDDGFDANLEQREAARVLHELLAELSPERREILVLVELEQMTVSEAADVLAENANTLQSRLRLAREDLSRACSRLSAEQAWRRQCATKTQR